ncbi:MAG: ATP-binding cassette domain-containing protein [Pseudomonadota bacterium]
MTPLVAAADTADARDKGLMVRCTDVRFSWPGSRRFTLDIPSLRIARGRRVLLLGPSGTGKSTLLSLLAGIVAPDNGAIEIAGENLSRLSPAARDRHRAERLGIIFQMFNLLPYGRAIDNVLLALQFAPARRARASREGSAYTEALRLLGRLGIDDTLARATSAQLSVGQQQRVAAARALIGQPDVVIADEPTSALDRARQRDFLSLLSDEVAASDATLIMVSHDETMVDAFDEVLHLESLIASSEAPQ